jgi:hypothetical protein
VRIITIARIGNAMLITTRMSIIDGLADSVF